jgi:hypothetical protein
VLGPGDSSSPPAPSSRIIARCVSSVDQIDRGDVFAAGCSILAAALSPITMLCCNVCFPCSQSRNPPNSLVFCLMKTRTNHSRYGNRHAKPEEVTEYPSLSTGAGFMYTVCSNDMRCLTSQNVASASSSLLHLPGHATLHVLLIHSA